MTDHAKRTNEIQLEILKVHHETIQLVKALIAEQQRSTTSILEALIRMTPTAQLDSVEDVLNRYRAKMQ